MAVVNRLEVAARPLWDLSPALAELRRMGRTSEAEETEAFATRYRKDQERSAEELLLQYRQQQ